MAECRPSRPAPDDTSDRPVCCYRSLASGRCGASISPVLRAPRGIARERAFASLGHCGNVTLNLICASCSGPCQSCAGRGASAGRCGSCRRGCSGRSRRGRDFYIQRPCPATRRPCLPLRLGRRRSLLAKMAKSRTNRVKGSAPRGRTRAKSASRGFSDGGNGFGLGCWLCC